MVEAKVAVPEGPFVLALDQGTTNTKALLVDASTHAIVASGAHRVDISYPAAGWVEQNADDIWNSVLGAVAECLADHQGVPIMAISISNQRESVAIWDAATGAALGPVLGWQDARTSAVCAGLSAHAPQVAKHTGLGLDAMFSAPKMRWLLDNVDSAQPARFGTIDTFLVSRLTGEYLAEAGNASRTMLFDLDSLDWNGELAEIFGVPVGGLAPIARSDAGFGVTRGEGAIPAGIPVVSVMADSHAALYLHSRGRLGEGKATYGTGSSVMVNSPRVGTEATGIATTLAWLVESPSYAKEGNVLASGAALAWAAELLTQGDVAALGALASETTASAVSLVPAFSGLGAPYFDRDAVGVLTGLSGATTGAQIARAAFEAVAHQVADVVEAIENDGVTEIAGLSADGGATASPLLMQLQADLLGKPLRVSDVPEASALGAALLAMHAEGVAEHASSNRYSTRTIAPEMSDERRREARHQWRLAVARSRGQSVSDWKEQ